MQALTLTGQRFGRLVAERRVIRRPGRAWWFCRCDCGKTIVMSTTHLRSGHTQSCGCLRREVLRRGSHHHPLLHGYARVGAEHELYRIWLQMIGRCTRPTHLAFRWYGARGVQVCERWRDFPSFLADVGERPSRRHSIERIDNNGHYEPGNVRWATRMEQMNNTRAVRWLTANGVRASLTVWALRLQVSRGKLHYWLQKKSLQEILAPDRFART